MTAPLPEIIEEGRRLQERHQRACHDLDVEAALPLGHDLNLYYLKHGPTLLAVAEAAVEMRGAIGRVHSDRRYMNVWAEAQSHLGPYEGATYTAELAAFDSAARGAK